jgi:alpha-beta hydrolase superfamily lysophospholipase
LRQAGFNVLLFDLRRHGESGGERVTLGYKERLDFGGAVSYLRQRSPGNRVFLFGVSMGAAAALLAAAEDTEIVAVIADSSFSSLDHTVAHHLKLFLGLPRFPLGDELIFFVEHLGEFRSEDLNLEEAVKGIGDRPLLFIAGDKDRRMPVEIQKRLFDIAKSPRSRFVVVEGAEHGAAFRTNPERYRQEMLSFLEEALADDS